MYQGQTYMKYTGGNPMTFEGAQKQCQDNGGYLPTVYSLNKYTGAKIMAGNRAQSIDKKC